MRLPGNTLLGDWFWPVEPGLLCDTELPWLARLEEKWWRLMTPAKPLPMRGTAYVDLLADLEDVRTDHRAGLKRCGLLLR